MSTDDKHDVSSVIETCSAIDLREAHRRGFIKGCIVGFVSAGFTVLFMFGALMGPQPLDTLREGSADAGETQLDLRMFAGDRVAEDGWVHYRCHDHSGHSQFPILLDEVRSGRCTVLADLADGSVGSAAFDLVGNASVICFHGTDSRCVPVDTIGVVQRIGEEP